MELGCPPRRNWGYNRFMGDDRDFPAWRKVLSAAIGAAMFFAFFGMCLFATESWWIAVMFGAVTLAIHFYWANRRRS